MLFVWAGCDTDDLRNDVDELKNRVESLEAQVSAINDNMNVLKVLTDGKQTIQSCVYDEASNSYKLVLSDNTELTLTQGKQGTVSYPQITISQMVHGLSMVRIQVEKPWVTMRLLLNLR